MTGGRPAAWRVRVVIDIEHPIAADHLNMAQGAIIVWVPDTIKEMRMDDKNVVTDVEVETLVEDVSIDGMCGVY